MSQRAGDATFRTGTTRRREAPPRKTPSGGAHALSPTAREQALELAAVWGTHYPMHRSRNFMIARMRWIIAIALAVVGAAAAMSWSRTPTYRSSAEVLVQPRIFAAGTPPQAPDMGSERALAQSATVVAIAAHDLHTTPHAISSGLSVTVPLNTHVLDISYASTDPIVARQRAQAVADAYVYYWISEQPALGNRPAAADAQNIIQSSVISDAKRPGAPASPNHVVDVAIAILVGLALGVGTAYLRDRLDDRLRGVEDLERRTDGQVLGVVPSTSLLKRRRPELVPPVASRTAAAYEDLAVHLVRMSTYRPVQLTLVTAPTGDAQAVVSANLTAALARADRQVLLVHADLRARHATTTFGGDSSLGLAAVLEGRADIAEAVQPTPIQGVTELPAGVLTGNVAAALHGSALRDVMRRLCRSVDFVVIDGPSVLAAADVATLAEIADCVVAAADARYTTRADVQAATARLTVIDSKLAGWVLVNDRVPLLVGLRDRLRRRRGSGAPQMEEQAVKHSSREDAHDRAITDSLTTAERGRS